MKDQLKIRIANINDAESILSLSYELGYSPTLDEIKNRVINFASRNDQEIYIAEFDVVIGWIHISLVEPLESNPFGELRGLVVTEEFRGRGVGTKLIATAQNWAKDNGCNRIRIRTNINRVKTVDYYRRLGFVSVKTQEVFEKSI